MLRSMIKNLIKQADPAIAAKNSFKKFHNPGIDYVNLLRTPDFTAKLYFCNPGRLTYHKDGCFGQGILVNPHDHSYDFDTFVISGHVSNVHYREAESMKDAWAWRNAAASWDKWEYRSKLKQCGGQKMEFVGCKTLIGNPQKVLRPGEDYSWPHDLVHSIWVPPEEETILFLAQYRSKHKYYTSLFSPPDHGPATDGLYEQMLTGEAQAYLERALCKL